MKFILRTVGCYYIKQHTEDLCKLGFTFSAINQSSHGYEFQKNNAPVEIEISTLEELLSLSVKVGSQLIVDSDSITIYDDYL